MRLHKPRWMFLLPPVALVLLLGISYVHGMGSNPSICPNRWDSTITSFTITYPGGTINALTTPNIEFSVPNNLSYNVTFTLHTVTGTASNSSLLGTTWYTSDEYGFDDGVCAVNGGVWDGNPSPTPNVTGNQDVVVSLSIVPPPDAQVNPQVYLTTFKPFTNAQMISFKVNWTAPTTGSTSTTTTSMTATSPSYTSTITIHNTSDFTGPTTTTSFFSSSSQQSASSQSASSSSSSSASSTTATSGTERTTPPLETSSSSSSQSSSSSSSGPSLSSSTTTNQSLSTQSSTPTTSSSTFLSSSSSQSVAASEPSVSSLTNSTIATSPSNTSSFLSSSSSGQSSTSSQSVSSSTTTSLTTDDEIFVGAIVAVAVAAGVGLALKRPSTVVSSQV